MGSSPELLALLAALAENKSVTNVRMVQHGIDIQAARLLGRTLQSNTGIKVLSLVGNEIGPEGVIALCQGLQFNTSLQSLDLSGNELHDEGGQAIANFLRRNTTLQHLNLTNDGIYKRGSMALFQALAANSSIQTFLYSKNHCLADGAREMGITLTTNFTLTSLDLSHNFIFAEGAKEIAKGLVRSIATQKSSSSEDAGGFNGITTLELRLGGNEIGDAGAKALAGALVVKNKNKLDGGQLITRLHSLLIPDNLITCKGIKDLAAAVANQSALTCLQLCDNAVGVKGAEALGKALKSASCGLQTLQLMSCEIPAAGIKVFCKHLSTEVSERRKSVTAFSKVREEPSSQRSGLITLDLSWNRFGADGGKHLGVMLAENTKLQTLLLSHNKLQCEGATTIASGLARNPTLRELDLSNNHIRSAGVSALGQAMGAHTDTPVLLSLLMDGRVYCLNSTHQHRFGNTISTVGNSLTSSGLGPSVHSINNCLARNQRQEVNKAKLAFLMALHPRVGAESSLGKVINESPIADRNILFPIWEFVFPPGNICTQML